MWDLSTLSDLIEHIIVQSESELRLEQAVYGLDSKDELLLHQILSRGLAEHFAVAREVHYPSTLGKKLTHRPRCDLVLSPKGKPLKLDHVPAGLFDPPDQATPAESLWLEVKVAYQFKEGGARHGGYGSQWRNAVVSDLKKMEVESMIHHAALLLIVFTESIEVLEKDLDLFESVLVQKEVLAGFRQVRSVGILERMGHRFCSVAIWPTVQR